VVLFADLDNPTSNRIYQQIGFEPVDDMVRVRFGE
jgi:predicted GNAT family acetyltransferase